MTIPDGAQYSFKVSNSQYYVKQVGGEVYYTKFTLNGHWAHWYTGDILKYSGNYKFKSLDLETLMDEFVSDYEAKQEAAEARKGAAKALKEFKPTRKAQKVWGQQYFKDPRRKY